MAMPSMVESSAECYQRLAAHLRTHPEAARYPAERLAEDLQIPLELVRAVLASAGHNRIPDPLPQTQSTLIPSVVGTFRKAGSRIERLMHRPMVFLFVVTVAGILVMLGGWRLLPTGSEQQVLRNALSAATAIAVMVFHYLCYFHTGRVRVAFMGAGLLFVLSLIGFGLPTIFAAEENFSRVGGPWRAFLILSIGLLFLCVMYLAVAVVLSVLGGYAQLKRADRQKQNLSRQELLARLFSIEEQLRLNQPSQHRRGIYDFKFVQWVRAHPYATSAAMSVIVGLAQATVLELGGVRSMERTPGVNPPLILALAGLMSFIGMGFMATIAFFTGRFRLALVVAGVYFCTGLLVGMIPIGPNGIDALRDRPVSDWVISVAIPLALAFAAGLGAKIEDRATRDRRLQANDPASLLAEMIDIQRRLNPEAQQLHILVVDVAKSYEMKQGADPLRAEFSFREYQKLVSDTATDAGGRVHSTAGDGAVVAFDTAADAFHAARGIQTRIEAFNRNVNRLETPFRLRIGIHSGVVHGGLDQVQFTQVIDVAAHVQNAAPVGGIAVTEATSERLEGEQLLPLREPIDGHPVLVAMEPTLDL